MQNASDDFKYEEAARLRNQLLAVESFYKKQKKTISTSLTSHQ